ncbi:hypothetical protein BDV06DRAFT_222641 [Aspergillus oleicola]
MKKSKKSKKVSALRPEALDEVPAPAEPPEWPAEEPAGVPEEPVEIEYNQPITSPYERIATVLIGTKSYGIPVYYLENIPQLKRRLDCKLGLEVVLGDVDEDIGHTLIHFLSTGQYETLNSGYNLAREYRRSVLAYETARRYGLLGLEEVARKHIKHFGALVHLQDVLETAKLIFWHLPTDETWFKDYLKEYFANSFNEDKYFFYREELITVIGESASFDRAIMQLTVDILFGRVSGLEKIVERVAERAPATGPEPEPEPEHELDPVPCPEPLYEPEAVPEAPPDPLSESESGLEPEQEPAPEPEHHSGWPMRVGDIPVIPPAEVVDVGFSEEDIPIPEPKISDAPEYAAEAPLGGLHQPTLEPPRPDYPPAIYDVSVASLRPQSPVDKPGEPEEPGITWSGLHGKRTKKKKKKGSLVVVEVDQPPPPPPDPVDWL